jgi:DNA-binding NarL/FixJ family response regulator
MKRISREIRDEVEGVVEEKYPLAAIRHSQCRDDTGPVTMRCLLVDDNAGFLEAASLLLQREGMDVVGVASNTAEALQRTQVLQPDLILVDIGLGDENGFDLARLLSDDERGSNADVIMVSARDESDYVDLIAESPAAGFVAKSDLSVQHIGRILSRRS